MEFKVPEFSTQVLMAADFGVVLVCWHILFLIEVMQSVKDLGQVF